MSENPGLRTRVALLLTSGVVFISVVAALWWVAPPTIRPWIKPSLGVFMILCGLVLLSPSATSRPSNEPQRTARMRLSFMGAGFVVWGAAQIVPSVNASVALMSVTVFLMVVAITGPPKRLFAPRS